MGWENPRFDRLWRLLALFILCGLVYYFSFDNGRQTAKARIARYEEERVRMAAQISSLKEQLKLQSDEIKALKGQNAPASATTAEAKTDASSNASPDAGAVAPALSPESVSPEQAPVASAPNSPEEGDLAMAAAGSGAPRGPDLLIPENAPPNTDSIAKDNLDPQDLSRISMRSEESKLILDGQVRLSILEIDSLDKVAQVRVQHLDSDTRHTRTMEAGDSLIISRGDERYILLLDQLKGSLAVFILIKS
ncbi:MAG: hypothetical protein LBE27_03530 [Deltaproteobacteria bacterium]|jgi:hypothetical protein|nr:hypothetical protein [Deltaproteobacteria bacterium]